MIGPALPSDVSSGDRRWELEDIRRLVAWRHRERADLAFVPSARAAGDGFFLAKLIAAMANGGGGTIVFGIEKDLLHRAIRSSVELDDLAGARHLLVRTAKTQIDGPVAVRITAIPREPGGADGYVVLGVRPSERIPHLVRGAAWGRSTGGVRRLRRGEVGELFARSRDFLEETGLGARLRRPARIVADVHRVGASRILMLRNVGERTAMTVRCRVVDGWTPTFDVRGGSDVVDRLPPSGTHVVHGVFAEELMPSKVEISWLDETGPAAQTLVVVT